MEAKDTVMSSEEQQRFKQIADSYANDLQHTTEGHFKQEDIEAIYHDGDRAMLNKQAEISFKAGIKEVVEQIVSKLGIVNDFGVLKVTKYCSWDEWQAFLKERLEK